MLELILDVETKKSFDEVGGYFPERLGVSFVGVCKRENRSQKGEMLSFFEDDLPELFKLMQHADLVVGYNIDDFDMVTLAPYYDKNIKDIPTLDIMKRIKKASGHRLKLDNVAKETLGYGKIGDGLDAIKYYREKQFDKLEKYCLQDVAVTRDVYDYGLEFGFVKFRNKWNRLIQTQVDFTVKLKPKVGEQLDLLSF